MSFSSFNHFSSAIGKGNNGSITPYISNITLINSGVNFILIKFTTPNGSYTFNLSNNVSGFGNGNSFFIRDVSGLSSITIQAVNVITNRQSITYPIYFSLTTLPSSLATSIPLYARYTASNFDITKNIWYDTINGYDLSGTQIKNSSMAIINNQNISESYTSNSSSASFTALYGNLQDSIQFTNTNIQNYTLFTVARYVNYARNSGRIFTSNTDNWFSGFEGSNNGCAFRYSEKFPYLPAIYANLYGIGGWIISTDTNSFYKANGTYGGPMNLDNTPLPPLCVNRYSGGKQSEFYIAEVLLYNGNLTQNDISNVEFYLSTTYGISMYTLSPPAYAYTRGADFFTGTYTQTTYTYTTTNTTYTVLTFTSTGIFIPATSKNVFYLVIGGGGGGAGANTRGNSAGGGGGGGSTLYNQTNFQTISANRQYNIYIGTGGTGGAKSTGASQGFVNNPGNNGGDSGIVSNPLYIRAPGGTGGHEPAPQADNGVNSGIGGEGGVLGNGETNSVSLQGGNGGDGYIGTTPNGSNGPQLNLSCGISYYVGSGGGGGGAGGTTMILSGPGSSGGAGDALGGGVGGSYGQFAQSATVYGCGGGGQQSGSKNGNNGYPGGNGANGVVILWY